MFQYTTWGRKIFFNFQILFLTPFCNQKRYFCVFWPFYAQILTKKPKIQKISKTMRFFTKVQNISIYNLGSRKILEFSDLEMSMSKPPSTWIFDILIVFVAYFLFYVSYDHDSTCATLHWFRATSRTLHMCCLDPWKIF